jgi:hypothetical protein
LTKVSFSSIRTGLRNAGRSGKSRPT